MAQVKAQLNNLRLPPRKVRVVINLVKGKDAVEALNQLEHFVKRPVGPVKKLIGSAIANAENNFNMVKDNLYIKELVVDEGRKLKRFRAKGFGRAEMIQKKTSHIRIVLEEKTPGLRSERKNKVKKEVDQEKVKSENQNSEIKKSIGSNRPEIKREIGSKGSLFGNLGKRLFQRKAV